MAIYPLFNSEAGPDRENERHLALKQKSLVRPTNHEA
jgi:hypothetical protein